MALFFLGAHHSHKGAQKKTAGRDQIQADGFT
jgi:hypothetical protein